MVYSHKSRCDILDSYKKKVSNIMTSILHLEHMKNSKIISTRT